MANRESGYGDLAERQAKIESKYDIEVEQQVRIWMEMVTGQPVVSCKYLQVYFIDLNERSTVVQEV